MYLILFKKQTPVRKVSEEAGDRVKNVFFWGGGRPSLQGEGVVLLQIGPVPPAGRKG